MEEFPEEPGYMAQPGWVKGNPLNNKIYLERCIEVYPEWAVELREAANYLDVVLPGYNIAQVKDKFGGLRFYWTAPEGADADTVEIARNVVWKIEADAPYLR